MINNPCFAGSGEHFDILRTTIEKGDVNIWNQWRLKHPKVLPDLRGLSLIDKDLSGINLIGADLSNSNLTGSNLTNAELSGVSFANANLTSIRLIHSSAFGGCFKNANLTNANLNGAMLNSADFSHATLTGAILRGVSSTLWEVSGVKCDYVFFDSDKQEREPSEGVYGLGEFEKLHKYLPKVKHLFVDEFSFVDILIMDKIVKEINAQNSEYDLKLDSFHAKGKPWAEFTISNKKDSVLVLEKIKAMHSEAKLELNKKLDREKIKVEALQEMLVKAISEPSIFIAKVENNYQTNQYENVWNNSAVSIENFESKLLVELEALRSVLRDSTQNLENRKVIAQIEQAEHAVKVGDSSAAIRAINGFGKWALDATTKVGTSVVAEIIKKSMSL